MSPERKEVLRVLKRELEFLEQGGYRTPIAWRPPLIFEDSPTCLRNPGFSCSESNCPILRFVPPEYRSKAAACRYIPLNDAGETVDSLYKTGTQEELEAALHKWLMAMIQELEQV
jgi:hypothetical protein